MAGTRRTCAPRTRYNVKTPHHILDVAAKLFAEHGYAAVTLKDIVKAAKVNVAAVNYHFGDKRNLYRNVLEQSLKNREQAAPLEKELERHSAPEDQLRCFIRALMIQLLDDSKPAIMSRLMLREAIEPTAAFARAVDQLPRRQLRILDGIIARMVPPGISRTVVRRMSLSVLGQCVYYRYAEKILKRTDPHLFHTKRGIGAIAAHIYRFSRAAIKSANSDRT